MRIFVQLTEATAPNVPPMFAIDHTQWTHLPAGVFVCALCIQGFWLDGFDWYHIEDHNGSPRFRGWADDLTYHSGARFGHVIDFRPFISDPRFDGAINTDIGVVRYSEDDPTAEHLWSAFVPPVKGRTVAGLMLDDVRYLSHYAARLDLSWRDWI